MFDAPAHWSVPIEPIIRSMLTLKCPVPIGFLPWSATKVDDSKDHKGVSFAELWADPVARTIWLGYKRFMITDQYFRLRCLQSANYLRSHPDLVLRDRIAFAVVDLWAEDWAYEIGTQLGPYLVWALQREGCWPFWKMKSPELTWNYVRPRAAR